MDIFTPRVKKEHIAIFLENMSFLIGCGYTAYDAAHWIVDPGGRKRDKEARAVRAVGMTIIDSLSEGFTLSTAMLRNPKYFGDYAKQIEAAEESGQVAEVLDQIVTSIRESESLTQKIKSAMTYPIIVLSVTFGVAWYLFSFVIPDILGMLTDVTGTESVPPTTKLVMSITDWMKQYGLSVLLLLIGLIVLLVFLAKGPLKWFFHRLYTRLPLIGKITLASNVTSWMASMRYMLQAGAPMANALATASDSIKNVYMKHQAREAYVLFATAGTAVADALAKCSFFTAMELGTINIGLESGEIVEVLRRLAQRRKEEADKAISAFIAALNPLIICILGIIVGVIVMSVYGPLINITQNLNA